MFFWLYFFNDLWNEFGRDNDDGYINFVGNIENVFVDWEFFFVDFNFVVFNVEDRKSVV